jgi:hypothetical protein
LIFYPAVGLGLSALARRTCSSLDAVHKLHKETGKRAPHFGALPWSLKLPSMWICGQRFSLRLGLISAGLVYLLPKPLGYFGAFKISQAFDLFAALRTNFFRFTTIQFAATYLASSQLLFLPWSRLLLGCPRPFAGVFLSGFHRGPL